MTRSRYLTLGLANPPAARPYRRLGRADVGSAAHRQLNLEAARGGIVLLQNKLAEGGGLPVLPLRKGQTIAAVGPNAQATSNLLSNYHPPAPPPQGGSAIVSPIDALTRKGFNVSFERGASINLHGHPSNAKMMAQAVALANASDVAIVFVGLDAGDEHESGDRNLTGAGLELPGDQEALIEAVRAVNSRTVVVLIHGGSVAIEWAQQHVPAIVDAKYPGAMGGFAIADVLAGDFNPCGRLTTTVYPKTFIGRSIFDTGLRSDGGLTYMHYDGKYGDPLWTVGDGISYSNFSVTAHSGPPTTISAAALAHGPPVEVSVQVTNDEGRAGCFTLLGFIRSTHPEAPRNRRLFDFARLNLLNVGSTAVLSVKLTADTVALVKTDGGRWILPGRYSIEVGTFNATFQVTGEPVMIVAPPPLFTATDT